MAQKENTVVVSVENVYKKLPSLPKGVTDFIVAVTPWLAIIFGILGVLGSLAAFGLSTVASPFVAIGGGVGMATSLIIASIIGLIESVMMIVAFPSLLKKKMFGWMLLFWVEVLAVVVGLINLSLYSIIVALIWFYFVFQIKSYYK
jgi:hypothetical protein